MTGWPREKLLAIGLRCVDVISQSRYDTVRISRHSVRNVPVKRGFSNMSERFDMFDHFAKSFRQAVLFGLL